MIPRRAHVLGAGISGTAAAEWLLRHGWMVIVSDDAISAELEQRADHLRRFGAEVILGGHEGVLLKPVQLVVASPGMPTTSHVITERRLQGVEVIGELELGWRNIQGSIAAVTGANGKSTTTALMGAIFTQTGHPSFAVGNIGTPLISITEQTTPDSMIALEVSSYQLETIVSFKPHVAALLNVTPDHLERHGGFEGYKAAKARIWENQTSEDWLVFNADDPVVVGMVAEVLPRKIPFSLAGPVTYGAWIEREEYAVKLPTGIELRLPKELSSLPGRHNDANVLAAICSTLLTGASPEAVKQGLASFKGLPHRLERVRVLDGVTYINDSKATNCDAGRWALEATPSPIILIAGGRPKGGGFQEVRDLVREKVKRMILIGEAAPAIKRELGDLAQAEIVPDLKAAIETARGAGSPGDTVLLSPLCASFDQFRNFEERGDRFREFVLGLK